MNDCFWLMICKCNDCDNCVQYCSMNSPKGQQLISEWDLCVEKALIPLRAIFAEERGFIDERTIINRRISSVLGYVREEPSE